MDGSVTLSNLPYTGFDLGPVYNNLFWVVLLIWSFVLARVLIKLSGRKVVQVSQKRVERKEQQLAAELARGPQILEERVIRYKDPGHSVVAHTAPSVSASDPLSLAARVLSGSATLTLGAVPTAPPEVEQKVAKIIEEELAETRAGESDDEFDESDFERVDFDGTNPDVYWRPRPASAQERQMQEPAPAPTPAAEPVPVVPSQLAERPQQAESPKAQKHYKDTLKLDTSEEYPRMVLTREEVAPR